MNQQQLEKTKELLDLLIDGLKEGGCACHDINDSKGMLKVRDDIDSVETVIDIIEDLL